MAKILVVDDEASLRLIVARILKTDGHEVIQAENGAQALAMAVDQRPDAVLLDYRLPGENGEEILIKLRAALPQLPVIMLTGYGRVEFAVDMVKTGAFDYVGKPFENKRLLEVVRRAVAQHTLIQDPSPLAQELAQKAFPHAAGPVTGSSSGSAPKPSTGHRQVWWWIAGVLAVALVGVGGWRLRRPPPSGEPMYLAPGTHTAALAWNEDRLWLSDWYLQKVYVARVEGVLEVAQVFQNAQRHLTGLAVLPREVIACDPWDKKIYRFARGAEWSPSSFVPSPGSSPSGLCWDGQETIWTTDRQTGRVYRHRGDRSLTITGEWPAMVAAPIGVAAVADRLWVADAQTETLVELSVQAEAAPFLVARYQLPARSGRLSGMTMGGGMVWLAYEGDREILRVPFSGLQRLP